jgi:large subunit ribosomal protein L14e
VEVVDRNYVLVTGPEVRRRKCNIDHLEPHEPVLEIEKGVSDEEVVKALKNEGLA